MQHESQDFELTQPHHPLRMATMITDTLITSPLASIRELMADDITALNQLISKQLYTEVALVNDMSQYIINSGGKRIRPLLALLSARAVATQNEDHTLLAAIIEFIHTATLLHDDVVDSAKIRRGLKAANLVWGNSTAVLVGDFLYSRAFQMMVKLKNMTVMDVLAHTTNKISEGEVLQLSNLGKLALTETDYHQTIYYKTAKLFEAATQLAAIVAGCNDNHITALQIYGKHFGMAYQLTDDALDYEGDSKTTGKNIGQDLSEGKLTLPIIVALANGDNKQQRLIEKAIQTRHTRYLNSVKQAIKDTHAIAYTKQAAKKEVDLALAALSVLPNSPYKQALNELAVFLIERAL